MSKKLFMTFVPLLAIAAFAVTPAAMAANNLHWYSNAEAKPIKEGKAVKVITFGEAKELSQVSSIGKIECASVGSGIIENPTGGGAGIGTSTNSTFYECKAEGCEQTVHTNFGSTVNYAAYAYPVANVTAKPSTKEENAPDGEIAWANKLYEGKANSEPLGGGGAAGSSVRVREALGQENKVVTGGTESAGTTGEIKAEVDCDVAANQPPFSGATPTVLLGAKFSGELDPEVGNNEPLGGPQLNGTSGCNKPSKSAFTGPSTGALGSAAGGEGSNSGLVKFCGGNASELITVGEPLG